MERKELLRYVVALGLSWVILVNYSHWLSWISKDEPQIVERVAPGTLRAADGTIPPDLSVEEEITVGAGEMRAKDLEPVTVTLETETYRVTFTNLGAGIKRFVSLTQRNGHVEENVLWSVADEKSPAFGLVLADSAVDLEHVPFVGPQVSEDEHSVTFSYTLPNQLRITKQFLLSPKDIRLTVEAENPTPHPQPFYFELGAVLDQSVVQNQFESRSLAAYSQLGDEVKRTAHGALKKKGGFHEGALPWAALGRRYFAIFMKPLEGASFDQVRASADETTMRAAARIPPVTVRSGSSARMDFLLYAGPTTRATLISYGYGFERVLASGIWGIFKTLILVMLGFFYKVSHNYGVAIIAVSVVTRVAFWPLTHMSFESMRKMQEIQPKLKALQEHHKNNPERLQKETMELYRRHKVNPLGGCLPMLLQIPVFFALYEVLADAVELRGAHFVGWIMDLSEPDVLFRLPFSLPFLGDAISILPLLMIVSMVLQQKFQPAQAAVSPEQQQIFKFMPIIFGFLFYKLPSGLVLYWTISNILSIIHQLSLRRKQLTAQ